MAQRSERTFECSLEDIESCPAAQVIKGLLIRINDSDKVIKLQSEIVIALQQKQYRKSYIESAIDDVKKRLRWDIDSHCEIYSRSTKVWAEGTVIQISMNEDTNEQWLTVKYDGNKKKEIQRFCGDVRPIGVGDEEYEFKEEVFEYIRNALKTGGVQFMESVSATINKYDYSATKLLDDLHHLKYDHGLNDDDAKFDAAYDFFKDSISGMDCNVNDCPFVQRHYRDRCQPILDHEAVDNEFEDDVVMDIMAMIHCYFVHSFDLHRMTRAEQRVVQDLILFFYAKPMNMNIEYGKERKQIKICPIKGTWYYLQNALVKELLNSTESLTVICERFQVLSHYGDFTLEFKGEFGDTLGISESEWGDTRWHEQEDVFIVDGSIIKRREQIVNLVVESHRAHHKTHSPEKLLDGKALTWYQSEETLMCVDWIIFKRRERRYFYPTKIMIRNNWNNDATKSLAIFWSEDGQKYHEWTQIDNIKMGYCDKQWFHLDQKERDSVFGKFEFIKLEIKRNHGNRYWNRLNEFGISGF